MSKPKRQRKQLNKLRARAEARLQHVNQPAPPPPTDQGIQRLVHELQVHQMELEMQNDELHRIQVELETARDRFVSLYDLAPTGYLTLDAEGIVGEANLTAAKILGIDRHDLVGQRFHSFVSPLDRDVFYLHQQETHLGRGKKTCELQMVKAGGARVSVQLESISRHDKKDFREESLVALRDITDRLQTEAERTRLAAIVESSTDAIISQNLDNRIISWNQGAEHMFGYSAAEAVGRSFDFLVQPNRRHELQEIRDAIQKGQKLENYETERMAKDGRIILVSATISPVKDVNGRIVGISTIARDITGQKEAEQTIRRSEMELADFFKESPLGLVWVDPGGHVQRINRAQAELLERPAEEIIGRHIAAFHADPEVGAELLHRIASGETLQNYRARFRAPNGTIIHVLIDANGFWERNKLVHSRWFVRDITRRMELEREILAISEREQRRIGQDLHDDLGQQLTGIEYLAQTLAAQLKPVSKMAAAKAREIARMVQAAMNDTRELAHGLAPVSFEADGLMIALRQLVSRTKDIFRIDCRFQCSNAVDIHDPEVGAHLYRIAQEAVNNAIKHGKARRIDVGLTLNGEKIVLAISDNGIGLPKRPRKRTGMGLRVMQYRAGAIGGSLIVQRQPDGGTTFVCSVKGVQSAPQKKI